MTNFSPSSHMVNYSKIITISLGFLALSIFGLGSESHLAYATPTVNIQGSPLQDMTITVTETDACNPNQLPTSVQITDTPPAGSSTTASSPITISTLHDSGCSSITNSETWTTDPIALQSLSSTKQAPWSIATNPGDQVTATAYDNSGAAIGAPASITVADPNMPWPTTIPLQPDISKVAVSGSPYFSCSSGYGADNLCNNWIKSSGLYITYKSSSTDKTIVYKEYCSTAANSLDPCPDTTRTQKQLYVEVDYMTGQMPDFNALQNLQSIFLAKGIQLHILLDEEIPHKTQISTDTASDQCTMSGVDNMKQYFFGTASERNSALSGWTENKYLTAKRQAFHYAAFIHDQGDVNSGQSGHAEISGNDFVVSLGTFYNSGSSPAYQEASFMHELGHNLGLDHGGANAQPDNCKPNYLSVMNYLFEFGTPNVPQVTDYSNDTLVTINDASPPSLVTPNTITGTNQNGMVSAFCDASIGSFIPFTIGNGINIGWDISDANNMQGCGINACDGTDAVSGRNDGSEDWTKLNFNFRDNGQGMSTCQFGSGSSGIVEKVSANTDSIPEIKLIDMSTSYMATKMPSSNIMTNKQFYKPGDSVIISGTVAGRATSDKVSISIYGPTGKVVSNQTTPVNNNGGYQLTVIPTTFGNVNGTYRIIVNQGNYTNEQLIHIGTNQTNNLPDEITSSDITHVRLATLGHIANLILNQNANNTSQSNSLAAINNTLSEATAYIENRNLPLAIKSLDQVLGTFNQTISYPTATSSEIVVSLTSLKKSIELEMEPTTKIVNTHAMFYDNNSNLLPPLKQIHNGVLEDQVICNQNMVRANILDIGPTCVMPETFAKLANAGMNILVQSQETCDIYSTYKDTGDYPVFNQIPPFCK